MADLRQGFPARRRFLPTPRPGNSRFMGPARFAARPAVKSTARWYFSFSQKCFLRWFCSSVLQGRTWRRWTLDHDPPPHSFFSFFSLIWTFSSLHFWFSHRFSRIIDVLFFLSCNFQPDFLVFERDTLLAGSLTGQRNSSGSTWRERTRPTAVGADDADDETLKIQCVKIAPTWFKAQHAT